MGRHSFPGDEPPEPGDAGPPSGRLPRAGGGWQGRRRRADGGPRQVSRGVVAALAAAVLLIGGVVLWRFFGDALSRRSTEAARECLRGTSTVAVVADPSIADTVSALTEDFNAEATPVGDTCVRVAVTVGDSDAVLRGLTGSWPAELGERPALWLPASSIQTARLQSAAGKEIVSDARSLVTSPVLLAVRPQLGAALGGDGWAALPGLQNDPAVLGARDLPGWGGLRLALPAVGSADASFLVAEAVATAAAPPDNPPTAGLEAASELVAGQPQLPENTADQAWRALTAPGDPAAGVVHAVAMTEQQLFARTTGVDKAGDTVAAWRPAGPAPVADYPTVLLSGPWLSEEQVTAASEFARHLRKDDQLAALAAAGFRVDGAANTPSGVIDFPPLGAAAPTGDDAVRAALAGVVSPAPGGATTVVLNEGLTGDEGGNPRLLNVTAALRERIAALGPNAAVGLWTFNRVDSTAAVSTGPLSEAVGAGPRSAAIAAVLEQTTPTSGGGVSFTTLRAAYTDALANYRPGQPNSVLVITQGPHTDESLDGPGLEQFITTARDPDRPVAVNILSFAGDPDRPTWEAVARLTGGRHVEIPRSDSPELAGALAGLVS